MQGVKLSVIIVNWNTKELLSRCLDSVYADVTAGCEVIVVDNGSSDGSVSLVRERFPQARLILNSDNLGFGVSNNKALSAANGKYVLFLNTDVILTEDVISNLMGFMDGHPKAALCTPSLIREDGSLQETYISFPGLFTELFGRFPHKKQKGPCKVEAIRGACMMGRRDVITGLGGFNERYFLFLEETDLCLRLKRSGYEVWYVPDVKVYHVGGRSAERDKPGSRIEYWRSRYIFFRENYSYLKYILLCAGLLIKLILGIFGKRFKVYLSLFLWHILGKPGDWGIGSRPAIGNIQPIDGVLIKENKSRKLFLRDNKYIKQYKSRFKRPWLREWRLINRVRQLDIPTVEPVACGNRYLVTKKIEDVVTLHDLILEDNINFNERLILTKSLAGFLNKLHKKGVYHGDLHAGNILVERKNGEFGFYITDLHRARIKLYLTKRDIINNLVQLDKFFSIEVSKSTRLRFLKYYASGMDAGRIAARTESSCHKLWRKRDSLYLKKDKYGIWKKHHGIRYIINPIYKDIPNIQEYIKPGRGEVIKDSRSSYLSRFNIPGIGGVVLKIYKRKRHGLRSWCGSWALITRGIRTPQPIAAGRNFIVTEDIKDAENLTIFSRKNEMPGKLPSYIKTLHDRGIFPEDMKGSNILVDKDGDIYLIDLDHIKIRRRVSLNERLYNINQIRRSTGLFCTSALPVRRILIVKPSSLGDIVQALPVAMTLRRQFPSSSIWWLANRNYIDLLRLVPVINKIIPFERERWWDLIGLIKFFRNIRKFNFDMVLDLQGLFRSGFITGFSRAPLRIGFGKASPVRGKASNGAREFSQIFYNNRIYTDKRHAQERYLALAGGKEEVVRLNMPRDTIWGDTDKVRIIINPGARWNTKRWYSNRYAELIDELDRRYDARIILIGDKDDMDVANNIANQITSPITNLSGKTTLVELAAVLNRCDILITNDSGPMHLANLLGRPVVAIFGPTDPNKTGPAGEKNKILKTNIPCSPCFKKNCKALLCMDEIGVRDVLAAVEDVLQKQEVVV